jgi:hypothetical protein
MKQLRQYLSWIIEIDYQKLHIDTCISLKKMG